jgi:hypothetical protein
MSSRKLRPDVRQIKQIGTAYFGEKAEQKTLDFCGVGVL